jgi:hypothetical protein
MEEKPPQPADVDDINLLQKIRRRCPRFYGVRLSDDGRHWVAAVRPNGVKRELILGEDFPTEMAAWSAYRKYQREHSRKPKHETVGRISHLLELAERIPVEIEVRSLYGSSLDLSRPHWRRHIAEFTEKRK